MSGQFSTFSAAVAERFKEMSQERLLLVDCERDEVWERYLAAFPPGSNPVFRKRTEHDCSCCRHFVRDVGNVVAVQNGALVSIWDVNGLPSPYQEVADALAAFVKSRAVCDVFVVPQARQGVPVSYEMTEAGESLTWGHFSVDAPGRFVATDFAKQRGELRTTAAVLLRGVLELSPDAVATVADLIEDGALYKGAEYRRAVLDFQALQNRVLALPEGRDRELAVWALLDSPAARLRNTMIGTLVQDLSDGKSLEAAVRSYDIKAAPENFKRTTALITKKMVEDAVATIKRLDLESALERRHARLPDVGVDSVLFVDGAVRGRMRGGLEDLLMQEVRPAPFDRDRAEAVGIEEFVSRVLPGVTGLRLYLENEHLPNLASLTAPVHADSGRLFNWGNDFAWSYDGDAADSIKARVKRAGGRVEGVALRASLAWFNTDDLDIHVVEPGGRHVYFGNKLDVLDVDMNAGRVVRDPVENLRWTRLRDGTYRVFVNQFRKRENADVGFVVEVESALGLETFRYERAVPQSADQPVCEVVVEGGAVREVRPAPEMARGSTSQERWGLRTQELVRVDAVVLSPNYWSEPGVGARHWFFLLDGCRNPDPVRGVYSEFLSRELEPHRRVFEVLGAKTRCPVADEQLSGVGFTAARGDRVVVAAAGPRLNKSYQVAF